MIKNSTSTYERQIFISFSRILRTKVFLVGIYSNILRSLFIKKRSFHFILSYWLYKWVDFIVFKNLRKVSRIHYYVFLKDLITAYKLFRDVCPVLFDC